jgi:hypothetical protein
MLWKFFSSQIKGFRESPTIRDEEVTPDVLGQNIRAQNLNLSEHPKYIRRSKYP